MTETENDILHLVNKLLRQAKLSGGNLSGLSTDGDVRLRSTQGTRYRIYDAWTLLRFASAYEPNRVNAYDAYAEDATTPGGEKVLSLVLPRDVRFTKAIRNKDERALDRLAKRYAKTLALLAQQVFA
jgi:hypothetical protein